MGGAEQGRVDLECRFEEKSREGRRPKGAFGANWDPASRIWYAARGVELAPLSRWNPAARTYLPSLPYHENEQAKAKQAHPHDT